MDAGDLGKFTIEEYYDGGTQVLLGEPLRFDKDNIAQWKDKFNRNLFSYQRGDCP